MARSVGGGSVAILDLDGTGPLEMLAESKYEDMWQQAPGEPCGLITTLRLVGPRNQHGVPSPDLLRLVSVQQQRPADFADSDVWIIHFGYRLLGS